ncbi:hypothetical protein [Halobaculum sp. EA56]|uniref:hypothetical protein n=1 Tax=Halobaculum sp. EA56 TaxID=3421648 RepID=UPI003EB8AB11
MRGRYIEFQCRGCDQLTLTEELTDHARHRECPRCFSIPDLRREPVDYRLPSLRWAIEAAPLDLAPAASEGEADGAGGAAASAPSGGAPSARAERGLAPDRAARAPEGGPTGPTENERRCGSRTESARAYGGEPTEETTPVRWVDE